MSRPEIDPDKCRNCGDVPRPWEQLVNGLCPGCWRREHRDDLRTDGGQSADQGRGDKHCLDYDGSETHDDPIEGEVTRHYFECPDCEFPLCPWTDCPDCGWYDEDAWERTLEATEVAA